MLVSFQFCAIFRIVPPWTFLCESSGKHVITFLSGTHPVVGLPGYMEVVGPSVTLWFVNFVYPFKELGIGFIDFFPRYCFKNLFHFLPDLYYLFSFYWLLGFICWFFVLILLDGAYVVYLIFFLCLRKACITVNFSLKNCFLLHPIVVLLCFHFHLSQSIF